MDQAPFSYPPPARETATRCGRKVFGWAATLQMLSFAMVVYGLMLIDWQHSGYYLNLESFWDWLIDTSNVPAFIFAGLVAMGVFVVASLPMGRLAGRAIMLRHRSYVWVGPLSMLLPSLLGSFTGGLMMIFLKKDAAEQALRSPMVNFWLPLAACCVAVYMTSILVGMLAGLLVRQMGYEAQERTLHGPDRLENMAETPVGAPSSSSLALKLGSIVFGIAAALQFVLLGGSASVDYIGRGVYSKWQMQAAAMFFVTGIVFTAMATLVGRWAGSAISKQPHRALGLAPAMMVFPAMMGALAHVIGGELSDRYYDINLNLPPWDTLLSHFFQMAILIFIPAALIAVLSGLVLRMLILPRQRLLMNNE